MPAWPTLLLLLLALLGAAQEDTAGGPPSTPPPPTAALVVIDGEIDEQWARYFRRALRQANEAKVATVVVHLTTDGGRLDAGLDMLNAALAARQDPTGVQPKLVAYIDNKAWSAGAMIAYAHQEIWLSGVAHIGDIGVIYQGADGEVKYAPEKFESPVRAHLRTVAEANGWPSAKLVKMTARDQELYRFDLPAGPVYVIEDDLGSFLATHKDQKKEQGVLILGKDRLVSYTAKEAVAEKMATGIVTDLNDLYAKLGIDGAQVLDLAPTPVERMSWLLAGIAPMLASLAVFFVILELKTPGVGIWTVAAVLCGVGFFTCQYYQDLASNLELVVILLGLIAIGVELFAFPTGGLLGIGGGVAVVSGLLLAFMPDEIQFRWNAEGFGAALSSAFMQAAIALALLTGVLVWLIRALPGMRAVDRIAATAEITATSAGTMELTGTLIGRAAVARSDLRPSGFITVDGQDVAATSEHGAYVQAGTAVEVIALRFGEAVVRPRPGANA